MSRQVPDLNFDRFLADLNRFELEVESQGGRRRPQRRKTIEGVLGAVDGRVEGMQRLEETGGDRKAEVEGKGGWKGEGV